jgi:parallel beta-helix repeat protein
MPAQTPASVKKPGWSRVVALCLAAVAAAFGVAALAGPLDPPPGPVTSTYKTLTEVEPRTVINAANTPGDADSVFKITQEGSYYLAGNVAGLVGKRGIEVAATRVTIDLNGFAVVGVAGSLDGIVSTGSSPQVRIRNGSVSLWGGSGIDIGDVLGSGVLEGVTSTSNGGAGIRVASGFALQNCTARSNGGTGIETGIHCQLLNCAALFNNLDGINASSGSTLSNCSVSNNERNGFVLGAGCVATNCTGLSSGLFAFSTSQGCTLTGCAAWNNFGGGFSLGVSNTIVNCTAHVNVGIGISASGGSSVIGCTVTSSALDGIVVSSDCTVRDNSCDSNGTGAGGGAGIRATGSDNRIEGNRCTDADRGIEVTGTGNIIVRNSCSGNGSNWEIAASNTYGPIINRVGLVTPAVSGDAAAEAIGSTHPNANFSY